MKLLFKQRMFSWFDSYDIYDEEGNTLFVVKGKMSWGHCLEIYDSFGNHAGTVKEVVLTFLPKFQMYIGDQFIGEMRKEFSFLKPVYTLNFNGWYIEGDYFQWEYTVHEQNGIGVMQASKQVFSFTDTYVIDVFREEDALTSLMIVLAIDAAKCSQN